MLTSQAFGQSAVDLRLSPKLRHVMSPPAKTKDPNDSFRLSVFVDDLDNATKLRMETTLATIQPIAGRIETYSRELNHLVVLIDKWADVTTLLSVPGVTHIGLIGTGKGHAENQRKESQPSTLDTSLSPNINIDAANMHMITDLRKEFGVEGTGVTVGIWDGGKVVDTHTQFDTRVTVEDRSCTASTPTPPDYCTTFDDHATHVAGTIASAGRWNPQLSPDVNKLAIRSIGMAPKARIANFMFANSTWAYELERWSRTQAPRSAISNHSWGTNVGWEEDSEWYGRPNEAEAIDFGRYDENARLVDDILSKNETAIVITAAGNHRNDLPDPDQHGDVWVCYGKCLKKPNLPFPGDGDSTPPGYDTLAAHKVAKNAIVVGARTDFNDTKTNLCDLTTTFSSWGPTDDGRIKPDIVANGLQLMSTTYEKLGNGSPNPNAYMNDSGTSMASPVVSGIAALLSELHLKKRGTPLHSDTLRAVLIHTADDGARVDSKDALGQPRKDASGKVIRVQPAGWHFAPPTYCAGYGSVNGWAAATAIDGTRPVVDIFPLYRIAASAGSFTKQVQKRAGAGHGIRVTIAWIDPPAPINNRDHANDPSRTLMHDLNLTVKSPGGRVFMPWTLDPANPTAPAQHCAVEPSEKPALPCFNTRDNVEVVDIEPLVVDREKQGAWTIQVDGPPNGLRSFALVTYGFKP